MQSSRKTRREPWEASKQFNDCCSVRIPFWGAVEVRLIGTSRERLSEARGARNRRYEGSIAGSLA